MAPKFLAFDGSGRKGSLNQKLLDNIVAEVKAAGGTGSVIDISAYDLPIYNGDLEADQGLPKGVMELKELFKSHDGFIIASPEYNGSFTPLMKNVIDWVSRPVQGEPPLNCFKNKIAAIMSAAPGKVGGLTGLYQLNTLLFRIGTLVLPDIMAVGFAGDAFDEQGKLKNDADKDKARMIAQKIVKLTPALK